MRSSATALLTLGPLNSPWPGNWIGLQWLLGETDWARWGWAAPVLCCDGAKKQGAGMFSAKNICPALSLAFVARLLFSSLLFWWYVCSWPWLHYNQIPLQTMPQPLNKLDWKPYHSTIPRLKNVWQKALRIVVRVSVSHITAYFPGILWQLFSADVNEPWRDGTEGSGSTAKTSASSILSLPK
jgi:hypothetical protein